MLPREHMFYGLLFTLAIMIFFEIGLVAGLTILFSSFLIDVDHYLFHIFRNKNFSMKKAYHYFADKKEDEEHKSEVVIFHTIEFLVLLIILTFWSRYFFFVAIGVVFHCLLDIFYMYRHKSLWGRDHSIINHWLKRCAE